MVSRLNANPRWLSRDPICSEIVVHGLHLIVSIRRRYERHEENLVFHISGLCEGTCPVVDWLLAGRWCCGWLGLGWWYQDIIVVINSRTNWSRTISRQARSFIDTEQINYAKAGRRFVGCLPRFLVHSPTWNATARHVRPSEGSEHLHRGYWEL